jgi:tetratricopeptide (TPR) repeat protein
LNHGFWPPANTIHEVKVDDVVVAAIVERKNWDDFLGSNLLKEGAQEQDGDKLELALGYLELAVDYDTTNLAAYLDLASAYTSFMRFEEARNAVDQAMRVYPSYDKALNIKGYSYLMESEVSGDPSLIDHGIRYISEAVKTNYKFYSGYYNLGIAYAMKDDMANSEYNFKQAIRYNSKFKSAYVKLAELYEYYGYNDQARQVREILGRIP